MRLSSSKYDEHSQKMLHVSNMYLVNQPFYLGFCAWKNIKIWSSLLCEKMNYRNEERKNDIKLPIFLIVAYVLSAQR